jgi:hypothetical protein
MTWYNRTMNGRIRRIIVIFFSSLLTSVAAGGPLAFASGAVTLPNPISATSFTQVVASITTYLIEIAIPLTAIMALVGGFQMITAAGNPEKFASGRKTLTYAAIGFVVVLLASGVAAIIKNFLGIKSQ